jgi:hypothetical protein
MERMYLSVGRVQGISEMRGGKFLERQSKIEGLDAFLLVKTPAPPVLNSVDSFLWVIEYPGEVLV